MKGTANASDYDQNFDCHPFWHIRRSGFVGEYNCDVVEVEIKNITNSYMVELTIDDEKTLPHPHQP